MSRRALKCFPWAHQHVSLGYVLCFVLLREIGGWAVCPQVEELLMSAAPAVEKIACWSTYSISTRAEAADQRSFK
jgi:hypothetical protein